MERKVGRPRGSRNAVRKDGVRVTIYMDRSALERVDQIASEQAMSRTAMLEEIIASADDRGKVRAEDLAR